MGRSAAFPDFPDDTPGYVVSRQQFRRPAGFLVPLRIDPALFGVVRRRVLVEVGNVVEHEPVAVAVRQDAALSPNALRDQDAPHARRPDHARRVELHEFHVQQRGPGVVGQAVAVSRIFPAVARDLEGPADAARGQDDRFRAEDPETSPLPVVAEGAHDPVAVLQQGHDGVFHVHFHALVDPVVLKGADHFQAGAVTHVGETGILVSAEVALQDAAVGRPVEQGAPGFQLTYAVRRFAGVQFGHAPIAQVLAAPHRVGEMDAPAVPVVHVGQRRRDAPFGHDRMGLAQQGLAHQSHRYPGSRGLDGRPESRSAGADHEHVMFVALVFRH